MVKFENEDYAKEELRKLWKHKLVDFIFEQGKVHLIFDNGEGMLVDIKQFTTYKQQEA